MRPTILVDVDGVLTDGFAETACRILRDLGYANAYPDAITQWNIPDAFGATKEDASEMMARLRREGVAFSFAPSPGAAELITSLRNWTRVVAVTAPLPGSRTWTFERSAWLTSQLGFTAKDIVNADDKSLIYGEALVEDRASNLRDWAEVHHYGVPILWDAPYNRDTITAKRVFDFEEVRQVLEANLGAPPRSKR